MMSTEPIAILNSGLVTPVGLTAPATCAAIRAKLANPTETRFIDSRSQWMMGHQVLLDEPWQGRAKLTRMAALAIDECLADVPRDVWPSIPMLLGVAERERPGRLDGLDDQLFVDIEDALGVKFSERSLIVPHGRVSIGIAMTQARRLIADGSASSALIVAVDSLLNWPTLNAYETSERLLTATNSNGFAPGEGAVALLVGSAGKGRKVVCTGIGHAIESATIHVERPLRGEGLAQAIGAALQESGVTMKDLDYRIADLSGEQYYFKEAALAFSRVAKIRKESFDLWHPAECLGEAGAATGALMLAVAHAACLKGYAPGPRVLCHAAADNGRRTAVVLEFTER